MHPHDQHHHFPTGRGERRNRSERPDLEFGPGPTGGRRGRRGGPGFGPPGFGPGPDGGRWGRGPRARGDVRAAILLLLAEQPRHGYELIQEIAERSSGAWTPSPGSVYPTLQVLEDEGLVTIESIEGRKTASLTPAGVEHVEEHRDRLGTPWESGQGDHTAALALRQEILALKNAVGQVARVGTPAQHAAATAILTAARKDLYRLLAGDDED